MAAAVVAPGHDYSTMGMASDLKIDDMQQQDCQQLVLSCNKEGMDFLRKGQYKQAFEQLKYAEAILVANHKEDEPTSLLAVTCNNLGCYYKKVGKLHAALSYLRKALKIEVSLQTDDVTVAGTHLNICAILSKLDKHDKAVQHALCALELISHRVDSAAHAVTQDEYSVLAIAYHNVAVERDYLHQWEQAHAAYHQGHQVAKKCLGEQHPLTQTLAKNCEAALQKAQKFAKDRSATIGSGGGGGGGGNRGGGGGGAPPSGTELGRSGAPSLPEIAGRSQKDSPIQTVQDDMPIPASSVHQEASDWAQSEDTAWSPGRNAGGMQAGHGASGQQNMGQSQYQPVQPAQQMMTPRSLNGTQAGGMMAAREPAPAMGGAPPGEAAGQQWSYPTFLDTIPRDVPGPVHGAAGASPPPLVVMGARDSSQAKRQARQEEKLKVAGQTVDDFMQGGETSKAGAPGGGSGGGKAPAKTTREQRIKERAARDRSGAVGTNAAGGGGHGGGGEDQKKLQQAHLLRKAASETVQRTWRAHVKYMKENRERIRREQASATKIQARYRAFHVRRKRLDKAAICIQRCMRGKLVRLVIRRHNAAVIIQRHAMGLLARKHLREFNKAATALQKIARGRQARASAQAYECNKMNSTLVIQRGMRRWKANKVTQTKRIQRDADKARIQASVRIQSVQRGIVGRKKAALRKREHLAILEEHRAATLLQASVRQRQALERVEALRNTRLQAQHKSATIIRKHWLRKIHRKRYIELRQEFLLHVSSIVTVQRYVRGFLVRLRMWRGAIRAEEELWASVEIQRTWRGYMGRLRWELAYEAVWSREVAALRLQRYCRGWLARTRVHRMRRKLARAEFEKARRRFKSSQKIQSIVRGWIVRRRTVAWRNQIVKVVTYVQRILRGHQLRSRLWDKVLERRAVQMQALTRGFLIRNRRFHFIANVICIQRHYLTWLRRVPDTERKSRVEARRARNAALRGSSA